MASPEAWARAMSVERWIERWMTHYHVAADHRSDVRHAVMLMLVEKHDRWEPERAGWMTYVTPWIRATVQIAKRDCERQFGLVSPERPLPYRNIDFDFAELAAPDDAHGDMEMREHDRTMACAKLRLTTRERAVFEMLSTGMICRDIAIVLECSRQRVSQIRARALQKMRAYLEETGGESAAAELQSDRRASQSGLPDEGSATCTRHDAPRWWAGA